MCFRRCIKCLRRCTKPTQAGSFPRSNGSAASNAKLRPGQLPLPRFPPMVRLLATAWVNFTLYGWRTPPNLSYHDKAGQFAYVATILRACSVDGLSQSERDYICGYSEILSHLSGVSEMDDGVSHTMTSAYNPAEPGGPPPAIPHSCLQGTAEYSRQVVSYARGRTSSSWWSMSSPSTPNITKSTATTEDYATAGCDSISSPCTTFRPPSSSLSESLYPRRTDVVSVANGAFSDNGSTAVDVPVTQPPLGHQAMLRRFIAAYCGDSFADPKISAERLRQSIGSDVKAYGSEATSFFQSGVINNSLDIMTQVTMKPDESTALSVSSTPGMARVLMYDTINAFYADGVFSEQERLEVIRMADQLNVPHEDLAGIEGLVREEFELNNAKVDLLSDGASYMYSPTEAEEEEELASHTHQQGHELDQLARDAEEMSEDITADAWREEARLRCTCRGMVDVIVNSHKRRLMHTVPQSKSTAENATLNAVKTQF